MSRRSFVMTLAAAAAAPAAQAQAPAPGTSAAPAGGPKGREQRMLIVDAQIHIWKGSKPNPNHRQIADYSADDALKEMDEAGVTAAVIHPPGWDPNANALAVEAARQHPNQFAILGNFPLDRPESRSLIDGWKGRPGMLGLRFALLQPHQKTWLSDGTMEAASATAGSDRLLRGRLRDGFFVTFHHLDPTRFGEWAIRRADGTIANLLHELDDDIVIVTVVLLSLQRRESERAAC